MALFFGVPGLMMVLSLTSYVYAGDDCHNTYTWNGGAVIKCDFSVLGTNVKLNMEFKLCRSEPELTTKLDIDALNVHTKKTGSASINIPLKTLGSVEVAITSDGPNEETITISLKPLNLASIPLYSESIGGDCNPVIYWFNSQAIGVFIGIGVAVLLLLGCCCYCCCRCCCDGCCWCCKKREQPTTVVVHSGHQMTPAQSNLPYVRSKDLDDIA